MPRGGSIRVTAEQKKVAAFLPMSHGELVPGHYVCLAVIDSGRGFGESVARRLFEPFFTTRSAGTGLGLATVHEIVRDHGGAMNVRSKPEHGSRFEAWLPAVAADSTAVVGPAGPPLGRGETVLVVESERERLLYNEEMLAALGYEPVGFERPADAIAACRSAPDRFDIILVSHASQSSVGLDLTRALHEAAAAAAHSARHFLHDRCRLGRVGGRRNFRRATPAPGQHRAGDGAGALPTFPRRITDVTRLPIAVTLL